MSTGNRFFTACLLVLPLVLLLSSTAAPQDVPPAAEGQAVSKTGLLPIYAVDFSFDPTWVDSGSFPSESPDYPHDGVNEAFRSVWDSLKDSGHNVLRVPVDLRSPDESARRLGNLLLWAQSQQVQLVPVLQTGEPGQPVDPNYGTRAAAYVQALLATLKAGDAEGLEAYPQILAYQLGHTLNHRGRHGGMTAEAAQARLLEAAAAVRQAEQAALQGTELSATPLLISASFDHEVVQNGAMAGGELPETVFTQAYASLARFLSGVASSADVDLLCVDWFPGSISAGDVSRLPDLLRRLTVDLGGKQVLLTTGFSTAFQSPEKQREFYTLAFANLADFRAGGGVDSPFLGVFFHQATSVSAPQDAPPDAALPQQVASWDRAEKAQELARMWRGEAPSPTLAWWERQVESGMALLKIEAAAGGVTSVIPQPAQESLNTLGTAVTEASQSLEKDPTAGATVPGAPPGPEHAGNGSGSSLKGAVKEKLQQVLLTLLDRALQRLTGDPGAGGNPFPNPGLDPGVPPTAPTPPVSLVPLRRESIRVSGAALKVGQPVLFEVVLTNQSPTAEARDLVVALLDESGTLLGAETQASTTVPPGSEKSIPVTWTPFEAKTYRITVQVADASFAPLTSVILDPLTVTAAPVGAPPAGGEPGGAPGDPGPGDNGKVQLPPGTRGGEGKLPPRVLPPRVSLPLGFPMPRNFQVGAPGQHLFARGSAPVTLSLSNPYGRSIPGMEAKLMVNGREVQKRSVGPLLPRQTRSLRFGEVSLLQEGKQEIRVVLETAAKAKSGFVSSRIEVLPSGSGQPGRDGMGVRLPVRPVGPRPTDPGALRPLPGNTPGTIARRPPGLVRGVLPPRFEAGQIAVATPRLNPGQSQPGLGGVGPRPLAGGVRLPVPRGTSSRPDMSLSAQDVRINPNPPKAGERMIVTFTARNGGQADAVGARVVAVLLADGRPAAQQEFPIDLEAGADITRSWRLQAPAGSELKLELTAAVAGEGDARDNRLLLTLGEPRPAGDRVPADPVLRPGRIDSPIRTPLPRPRPGGIRSDRAGGQDGERNSRNGPRNLPHPTRPGELIRPGDAGRPVRPGATQPALSIQAREIRFVPGTLTAGQSITFTIPVRNGGPVELKDVSLFVTLLADGKPVRQQRLSVTVGAGREVRTQWRTTLPHAREWRLVVTPAADDGQEDARRTVILPLMPLR